MEGFMPIKPVFTAPSNYSMPNHLHQKAANATVSPQETQAGNDPHHLKNQSVQQKVIRAAQSGNIFYEQRFEDTIASKLDDLPQVTLRECGLTSLDDFLRDKPVQMNGKNAKRIVLDPSSQEYAAFLNLEHRSVITAFMQPKIALFRWNPKDSYWTLQYPKKPPEIHYELVKLVNLLSGHSTHLDYMVETRLAQKTTASFKEYVNEIEDFFSLLPKRRFDILPDKLQDETLSPILPVELSEKQKSSFQPDYAALLRIDDSRYGEKTYLLKINIPQGEWHINSARGECIISKDPKKLVDLLAGRPITFSLKILSPFTLRLINS